MGQGQLLSLLVRANLQGYKKDLSIEIEKVLESFKLDLIMKMDLYLLIIR